VTLSNAGAPESTLTAIVVLFAALVVLIGPSFGLLFALQGRQLLRAGGDGAVLATTAAQPGGRSTARTVVLGVVAAGALVRVLRHRRRGQ
jgi:hypothetical protein